MENPENKTNGGGKKKYRPRLSSQGKAFLKKQPFIVIIHKVNNDTRAELCDGDMMVCSDPICHLAEWINTDLMMLTECGFIVGFAFVDDVIPEGERSRLKMSNGMWANVTKSRNSDFKCRYERYKRNNNLTSEISK
jgi:hypothetical protein